MRSIVVRTPLRLLILNIAVFGANLLLPVASAQQKRWAAVTPNNEASSSVVWGDTEAQVRQRAIDACKRISKTCASEPALTQEMDDVFAVMCCTKPRQGCASSVARNRQSALHAVEKVFADAGYSNCTLRHYISAGTGKKL
jgi:hypothetical protein